MFSLPLGCLQFPQLPLFKMTASTTLCHIEMNPLGSLMIISPSLNNNRTSTLAGAEARVECEEHT